MGPGCKAVTSHQCLYSEPLGSQLWEQGCRKVCACCGAGNRFPSPLLKGGSLGAGLAAGRRAVPRAQQGSLCSISTAQGGG